MKNTPSFITLIACFTLVFLIGFTPKASSQPNVDIGLFDAGNNTIEVRLRPDSSFNQLVSSLVFTIRWDSASGAHLGAVNQLFPELFYIPTSKAGPEHVQNGYSYQIFVGIGFMSMDAVPGFPGLSWTAGQEVVLFTIPVTGGSGDFQIVNDTFTGDVTNNGDYFISLNGLNRTGVIYTCCADLCDDLSLDTVITDVSCLGAADGAIDLMASGATPPYSFLWSDSSTTEDLSGIVAGSYHVTVSDIFGCSSTLSANVSTQTNQANQPISCTDPPSTVIPTTSEWGLILLSLLFLSFATVSIRRQKFAFSLDGLSEAVSESSGIPFQMDLFLKSSAFTLGSAFTCLSVAFVFFQYFSIVDLIGALSSAIVFAYLVHLWLMIARKLL